MFRRRKTMGIVARVRAFVWPERGFRRLFSYLAQRVRRMPGTPASIATGLACGVAVSFTPFLGFHLLLGAFLAYLMRGNLLASGIGTAIGNPWTFPLIFLANYELGLWLLRVTGFEIQRQSMSLSEFTGDPAGLLMPLILGGLTMGIIGWFASFGMAYWALTGWREHRVKRLAASKQRQREREASMMNKHSDDGVVTVSFDRTEDSNGDKKPSRSGGRYE